MEVVARDEFDGVHVYCVEVSAEGDDLAVVVFVD